MVLISTLTKSGYQLTDIDTIQLCKKINDHTFEYREPENSGQIMSLNDITETTINDPKRWRIETIDVTKYDERTIIEAISPFGYKDVNELTEIYGEEKNQIIAECLFEMEMV